MFPRAVHFRFPRARAVWCTLSFVMEDKENAEPVPKAKRAFGSTTKKEQQKLIDDAVPKNTKSATQYWVGCSPNSVNSKPVRKTVIWQISALTNWALLLLHFIRMRKRRKELRLARTACWQQEELCNGISAPSERSIYLLDQNLTGPTKFWTAC